MTNPTTQAIALAEKHGATYETLMPGQLFVFDVARLDALLADHKQQVLNEPVDIPGIGSSAEPFVSLWKSYCDKKSEVEDLQSQLTQALERVKELEPLLEFVTDVSKQTPEKPDYWSSCGQCERNNSRAEDLLEAIQKGQQS